MIEIIFCLAAESQNNTAAFENLPKVTPSSSGHSQQELDQTSSTAAVDTASQIATAAFENLPKVIPSSSGNLFYFQTCFHCLEKD